MTGTEQMRRLLEGARPLLAVVVSMALVMSGILIGSRLPGRDVTLGFPEGLALNYAGAPADSFVPTTALSGSDGAQPTATGAGGGGGDGTAGPSYGSKCRPHNPHDLTPQPCDESQGFQTQSVEYVATPAGLGVQREDSPAGVGGQIFFTRTELLAILVEDDNGPGVAVFVCQRYTPDGRGDICSSGDVEIYFCSTGGARDVSAEGLRPGYVRIRVDTTSTSCPTAATTGTITITW
jgi:hypothetical protein